MGSDHDHAIACRNCKFWTPQKHPGMDPTTGRELLSGWCRRYPPGVNGFALTSQKDWCGEFVQIKKS